MRPTRVEHHVYLHLPDSLLTLGEKLMSNLDDIKAEQAAQREQLGNIATAQTQIAGSITNVAGDIDDILAKLAAADPNSPETADILAEAKSFTSGLGSAATALTEQAATLQAVADKYTPPTA